jgi:transposase
MADNFLACDRDHAFLLPPDLRDWLPADHLAWFVRDVIDQLDLQPFLKAYRADGHGHAAYQPRMLLAVLLYAYCTGIRSSRQIERRCHEDIAFRVLGGNSTPDHVTIARFRIRHEQALAGLLVASLRLCAAAARQQRYQQRVAELAATARARGQRPRAHVRPRRRDEASDPAATVNTTDPDSRLVRGNGRTLQGYNAQAASTLGQVVVAAELTQRANDVQQLAPMLAAIGATLAAAGIGDSVQRLAADSGYWSIANVSATPDAPELLIPPARHGRHGKPARTASPRSPRATACGRRCGPGWTAPRARPATPSAAGPSSRSSGRSRRCRATGGSCAGGCGPARPSGSCCAAPTTCSGSGAIPAADRHRHRSPSERSPRPPPPAASTGSHGCPATPATPKPHHSTVAVAGCGLAARPSAIRC